MDHYYRTVRGLAVLIEKEWVAFGHKFAQRHGVDKNIGKEKDEQRAPIFFQFLDCVYQLVLQCVPQVCCTVIRLSEYQSINQVSNCV